MSPASMHWLVRLYPPRWRRRYEAEFVALLEDVRPRGLALVNVLVGALLAHFAPPPDDLGAAQPVGGIDVTRAFPPPARQTAFALAALALLVPTIVFLSLAVLKYWLALDAPFDAALPVFQSPVVEQLVVAGPFLALPISTLPVVRVDVRWEGGWINGSLEWRARALNIIVSALSAALIVVLLVYFLIENF